MDTVDYCAANPNDIIATPDNCAQYYNCTERQTTIGDHVMECKYPDLFSKTSHSCENFEAVQCTIRKEPQAPCKLHFYNFIRISRLHQHCSGDMLYADAP